MLTQKEIDAIKGRYEEYTDTDEWEVSIDNIDDLLENLFQDITKLLSHIAQQEAEVDRLGGESWYWRLGYQQMKEAYDTSKSKAQRFYNERNYYKGYADRYSDVIEEKDDEINLLKRKLAIIEYKAYHPVKEEADAVGIDYLYEIYLHAKEEAL